MIRVLFLGSAPMLLLFATAAAAPVVAPAAILDAAADAPEAQLKPDFNLIEHRASAPAASHAQPLPRLSTPAAVGAPASRRRAREQVLAFIRAAELRHALPAGLLDALVSVESAYRPDALSRAGAMGLAQLMPRTAAALGVLNPFDPRTNLDGGARFLKAMIDRFGSVALALAAYNAGPGAVLRARGVPANRETPGYVRKVLAEWSALAF